MKNGLKAPALVMESCLGAIEGSYAWLRRLEEGRIWAHANHPGTDLDLYFQTIEAKFQRVTLLFSASSSPSDLYITRDTSDGAAIPLRPFIETDTARSFDVWLEKGRWVLSMGGKQWKVDVETDCPALTIDPGAPSGDLQCAATAIGPVPPPPPPTTTTTTTTQVPRARVALELDGEWAPKVFGHSGGGTEGVGIRYRWSGATSWLSARAALRFVPDTQGSSVGRVDELLGLGAFFPFLDTWAFGPFADLSIFDVGPVYFGVHAGLHLGWDVATFLTVMLEGAVEGYPESGQFAPVAETLGAGLAFNLGVP